ncbi:MAG: RNA methyltransferase [Oligoflexia bacterium]|nr:RNA methyltransferase [Oligoflexia bacterium]
MKEATASKTHKPAHLSRKEEQRIIGRNACHAVFAARPGQIRKVYLQKELRAEFGKLLDLCVKTKIGFKIVSAEELQKISASEHHEGVCVVADRRDFLDQQQICEALKSDLPKISILILDGVENPHNFGAIVRTAAYFGAGAVLVGSDSSLTISSAVYRTSEGGCEHTLLGKLSDLKKFLDWAREQGFSVYAAVPRSALRLGRSRLAAKSIVLLGAEREGLPARTVSMADRTISIPDSGTAGIDSLNVGVAASIFLWEHARVGGIKG